MPFFNNFRANFGPLTKGQRRRIIATGGNTTTTYVENGKTYKVHMFTSSGSLVLSSITNVEYIVVGGGGGGGAAG
jgi:hypothetical protein